MGINTDNLRKIQLGDTANEVADKIYNNDRDVSNALNTLEEDTLKISNLQEGTGDRTDATISQASITTELEKKVSRETLFDSNNLIIDSLLNGVLWGKKTFNSLADFYSSLNDITNYTTGGKTAWLVAFSSYNFFVFVNNTPSGARVETVMGCALLNESGEIGTSTAPYGTIIQRRWFSNTWEAWKYLTKGDVDVIGSITDPAFGIQKIDYSQIDTFTEGVAIVTETIGGTVTGDAVRKYILIAGLIEGVNVNGAISAVSVPTQMLLNVSSGVQTIQTRNKEYTIVNNTPVVTGWSDWKASGGLIAVTDEEKTSIISGDNVIIEDTTKLLYFKAKHGFVNITDRLLVKIKDKTTVDNTTGVVRSNTAVNHRVCVMGELKPNTRYIISGFQNTWGSSVPYFFLYDKSATDTLPSIAASKIFNYSDLVDGLAVFTTDDNNTKLSMYTVYTGGSYPAFNSESTLKLQEWGESLEDVEIVDENGRVILSQEITDNSNPLQTSESVQSSFSIIPSETLELTRDKIFKILESGKYSNTGAKTLKSFRNGKHTGESSNEISINELKDNDVYFSFDNKNEEWSKLTVAKEINDILDITNTQINAAWCWFGSPNFLYRDGKTFIGIVDGSNGRQSVVQYNHEDNTFSKFALGTAVQKDDHNQPSFIHLSDGRLLAVYSEHSANTLFRYRVSTNANDATAWEAEQTVSNPQILSYSHLFKLANGNIVNIYRQGGSTGAGNWSFRIFDENTLTFGDIIRLHPMSGGYVIPYQDDLDKNIIHIVCTIYHPNTADNSSVANNIYYYKADLSTNLAYKADDTLIGSLPLTLGVSDLDVISEGAANTKNQWIEDVIVKYGKARVLFNIYPDSKSNNAVVKHLMFSEVNDSGQWTDPVMICRPLDGYVESMNPPQQTFIQ